MSKRPNKSQPRGGKTSQPASASKSGKPASGGKKPLPPAAKPLAQPAASPATLEERFRDNRALWDMLAPIHAKSDFYDAQGFLAGKNSLRPLEIAEVGDVRGKSLLHLQCHFGLDALSWARLGAKVVGVDFSEKSIELARGLAKEANLDAEFIAANIYDLPSVHAGQQYDVVFASYGVLPWLPDLKRWAEIVASFLKPGGFFYIVESHPFARLFDVEADAPEDLLLDIPYFHSGAAWETQPEGTYADPAAQFDERVVAHEWTHRLEEIIGAILGAGLRLDFLHEHPFTVHQRFTGLIQDAEGRWRFPEGLNPLPLLFSLKATKEK